MKVIVDTPIWSLALRRRCDRLSPHEIEQTEAWQRLVRQDRIAMLGVVRQEVMSGVKDASSFRKLASALRAFPDEPLSMDDYEQAAECYNACAASGVSGSHTDFLICAVAIRRGFQIFTKDADFPRYAKRLPLRLYTAGSE